MNGCINNFITQYVDCPQYAYIIRDLCYLETMRILSFSPALR